LRHLTRERRSPDSSFASLPSIASRVLTARPRVRPQPLWRLRVSRAATAVSLAVIAIVVIVYGALSLDWETPYREISKVAKPIESRIHFGKEDNDDQVLVVSRRVQATTASHHAAPHLSSR
jgi:hypothetical protein